MYIKKSLLLLLVPVSLFGAARDLKEHVESTYPKGFFVVNATEDTFNVRARVGGNIKLEEECRKLSSTLKNEHDDEKKVIIRQNIAIFCQQIASLFPIRVIVPDGISTEDNEFFLLPSHAFFIVHPVDLNGLRIRVWPHDAVLKQDVDEYGKPTMTSDENLEKSLTGWAGQPKAEIRGLVLQYKDGKVVVHKTTRSLQTVQRQIQDVYYRCVKTVTKEYTKIEPVGTSKGTRYTPLDD